MGGGKRAYGGSLSPYFSPFLKREVGAGAGLVSLLYLTRVSYVF